MGAQRWLILDASGEVANVVLWDADADPTWSPPEGYTVRLDVGNVADVPDTTPPPTVEDKLDAIIAAVLALVSDRASDAADAIATITEEPQP